MHDPSLLAHGLMRNSVAFLQNFQYHQDNSFVIITNISVKPSIVYRLSRLIVHEILILDKCYLADRLVYCVCVHSILVQDRATSQ